MKKSCISRRFKIEERRFLMDNTKKTTTKKPGYGDRAKASVSRYKSDIGTAYDRGYAKGWDDAYDIPGRFGAQSAAALGYKKGMRNRHRTDKYVKQYARQGKKYSYGKEG